MNRGVTVSRLRRRLSAQPRRPWSSTTVLPQVVVTTTPLHFQSCRRRCRCRPFTTTIRRTYYYDVRHSFYSSITAPTFLYKNSKNHNMSTNSTKISWKILQEQNATTSNAIIDTLGNHPDFQKLAEYEGTLTVNRDKEDDDKLQVGIEYAQSKGVLDPEYVPEPYVKIDVLGKTPAQVAQLMLDQVNSGSAASSSEEGSVIVLCGLSGTGKGTTVEVLKQTLTQQGKSPVTWSNGNVFRSVTLLATTWCQQQQPHGGDGQPFDKDAALTPENLQNFMTMLSFGKHPQKGNWDIHIQGLGLEYWVSDIQNTVLKSPQVSQNIPTVAQVTQGEVVQFAAQAVKQMSAEQGVVVLLEGREQTVNYVRTPHRFTLMLSDDTLIGKRRAAQRLMAAALEHVKGDKEDDERNVLGALESALTPMVKDI